MKLTLVVMAAGMGSRYGGLKQIEPVGPGGEIVVDYSAYDALRAGFGKIVFIIRKDIADDFRAVIEPRLKGRISVEYTFQELDDLPAPYQVPPGRAKPWGTAHAILSCRKVVREPFGVINADDFYGRRSFEVLARFLGKRHADQPTYALVGFHLKNTLSEHGSVSRGVCDVDAAGRLVKIVEHPKIEVRGSRIVSETGGELAPDTIVSMNMWGFTPAIFPQLESLFISYLTSHISNLTSEFYIPAAVDSLIRRREASVDVMNSPDAWLGMTYPEDKSAVRAGLQQLIRGGEYPEQFWP